MMGGAQRKAGDYLGTGLFLFFRSRGEIPRFLELLGEAHRLEDVSGFHPTIPVSLIGALHGRKNLPAEFQEALFKRDFDWKRFYGIAKGEFPN